MKKQLSSNCITLAMAMTLFISACTSIQKTSLISEQLHNQKATAPVEVSITSLNDLTALFVQLQYNRNSWTKDNGEVARLTFNGISENWQETAHKLPVKVKKEVFFRLMTPLVLIANEKIEKERELVKHSALNSPELKKLAVKYRLIENAQSAVSEKLRSRLLQRVDILPPSLALAQAAEESGWATSRFAIEGNAFFGQWDFSGKGMKPRQQRAELGNYGVARFATPLASVEAYMLNINSNRAYRKLRILRAQLRAENKTISGYQLATTLDKYSERGQAYIDGLQSMIRYNKLAQIDQANLADHPLIKITSDWL